MPRSPSTRLKTGRWPSSASSLIRKRYTASLGSSGSGVLAQQSPPNPIGIPATASAPWGRL